MRSMREGLSAVERKGFPSIAAASSLPPMIVTLVAIPSRPAISFSIRGPSPPAAFFFTVKTTLPLFKRVRTSS